MKKDIHTFEEHLKYIIRHALVWCWPIISLAITQYTTTWAVDEMALLWLLGSLLIEASDRAKRIK